VVRRLKDDVARGDPPRPISRRHPPQPIVVAPTVREKEIHQRLRGHSKRVLRALRGTDSYHVQAFALEVLRKRALSSPRALLLSLQRRAASLGITLVEHAGRRRLEAMELYRGDVALTDADLDETEELALSGVAHMPDDDLREEQRLVGTLLELAEAVTPADDSKLTRPGGQQVRLVCPRVSLEGPSSSSCSARHDCSRRGSDVVPSCRLGHRPPATSRVAPVT
jgi:hypothetical protein